MRPYPELTNTMPPATVAPPLSSEPPTTITPFTVSKVWAVSKSQITRPSLLAYARRCPSCEPENTAPGMAETACDCAARQLREPQLQTGGGGLACQTCLPSAIRSATRPPGLAVAASDTAAYIWLGSAAEPHSIPPRLLPVPTCAAHTCLPLCGSRAYI